MKFFILRKNYLMKRYFKILFIICVFLPHLLLMRKSIKKTFQETRKKSYGELAPFPLVKNEFQYFSKKKN